VTLAGKGQAQVWDAADGTIKTLEGATSAASTVTAPLALAAQEARFIVLKR
jgi:hypothetical protein